jgi:hypothetical protein
MEDGDDREQLKQLSPSFYNRLEKLNNPRGWNYWQVRRLRSFNF